MTEPETGMVFRAVAEPLEFPGGDGLTLEGYAAVYNRRAHIVDHMGEYDEIIKPGAFTRSINARTPFLMYQHGRHPVFGQFPLGKIETLREDEQGLFVRARLVDTPFMEPIRAAIRDGAITGMSVAMESPKGKATWSNAGGVKLRSVNEAKLFELGPVLGEAYSDTTVAVRAIDMAFRNEFPDAFPVEDDLDARVEAAVLRALEQRETGLTIVQNLDAGDADLRAIANGIITGTPEGPDPAVTPGGPAETTEPVVIKHNRAQVAREIRAAQRGIHRRTA